MKNHSAQALWAEFLESHPEYASGPEPAVDLFGDTEEIADECIQLVLKGQKKASAHSLLGLQLRGDPLPRMGDLAIITDWEGTAHCIIRTIQVRLTPFFGITAAHAALEGEGDGSLDYWRESHQAYFTRELEPFGKAPTESMIVVFEVFEKIFDRS